MNKTFKLCISCFITVSMILSCMVCRVFAANSTGIKSIYADFEETMTVGDTTSAYGASASLNQKDTWKSKIEPAVTSDSTGADTRALHINWYNLGSGTGSGWDTMWNISNLDISTSTVLNFDIKLDTIKSQFRLQYRYKKTDGTFSTFTLMHIDAAATSSSKLTMLNTAVSNSPITSADTWYNVTIELNYNSTANTLKGSAWIDGTKLIDETTSNLGYNLGTAGISGVTGNFFRFVGYWNGTTAQTPSGIWLDNIMFSQSTPYYFSATPAAGQKITGNTAELFYPAKLDKNTLDGITVTKDGEDFTPVAVTVKNNTVLVKLTNEEQAENGEYTIGIPDGAKDIRGTLIPQSARTLTFRSGDPIIKSFTLVSPSDGLIIEKGKEFAIKAVSGHIPGADVEFYVNDTQIADVTSLSDGTYIAKWTPVTSGSYNIKAIAAHESDNFVCEAKNITVLGSSAYTSNWRNIFTNSNPTEMADGTTVANGYTTTPIIFKRTQDSAPYTKIYNSSVSSGYNYGIIVAEAEVEFSPVTGFNIFNRNAGSDNKGQTAFSFGNDGKIYFYNGTTSADSGIAYDQTKNHHIKTIWDLANKKIYLILNGEQVPVVTTMRSDWQNIYDIRFNCSTTKSASANPITLKNERLTYYPPKPVIESTQSLAGGFEITYSVPLQETTITDTNIKLYRGSGSNAPVGISLELIDGKTVRITPKNDNEFTSSAEYRAEISGDVTSAEGAKTVESKICIFRVAPGDVYAFKKGSTILNDLSLVQSGNTVTFTSDITGGAFVVMALYGKTENGNVLKKISVTPVSSSVTASLTFTSNPQDGDTLYAYVLDSSYKAICDEYHISR